MKVHEQLAQGSQEWLRLRAGKVTASGVSSILTDAGKARTGQMPKTYRNTLIGETLKGRPIDEITGDWLERGKELEEEARRWLAFELGQEIHEVGFLESDCGRWGASPDGVIADGGVELKCPALKTHIGTLLENDLLLSKYGLQVQFGLWVSGWSEWILASYCPDVPGVILRVKPDPALHRTFAKVVPAFAQSVSDGVAQIRGMQFGDDELGRMAAEVFG